ncbi:MAG: winged helix-turn-helix transcriptional regulator [Candidatus Eisenbacteria bacterium]|nr:winged helix-turn-helix transcriptional regulator [Candidatus Eisenbacteria bacterium]MCC7141391.1 winged helix-turn-helix transcriptional regulator [Candidatus Eisenbacteria bacterium]
MASQIPNDPTLDRIAQRFRLLGDPVRLKLLHALREGERTVTALVKSTGAGQANVSKHLALMLREGVVARRKQGLHVYYAVTDAHVFELCDVVCGGLNQQFSREIETFSPLPSAGQPRRPRAKRSTSR